MNTSANFSISFSRMPQPISAHIPFTVGWCFLMLQRLRFLHLLSETLTFSSSSCFGESIPSLVFCLKIRLFVRFGQKLQKENSHTQSRDDIKKSIYDAGLDHLVKGVFACALLRKRYYFLILCSLELSQLVHFSRRHRCWAPLLKEIVHIYNSWTFSIRKECVL